LWQYLWNCAGVALFLPIYSHLDIEHRVNERTRSRIPKSEAQALPLSAAFSLLLPVPLLLPAALRATPTQIQVGLVGYFLTPALLVLFQTLASTALSSRSLLQLLVDQPVKAAYMLVGSASVLTHVGILFYVLFLADTASLSLVSLYVPNPKTVQAGKHDVLTTGALLFFQWDFIIICLTVICHSIYLLRWKAPEVLNAFGKNIVRQGLTLAALTVVVGPGAVLAFILWSEENAEQQVNPVPGNSGTPLLREHSYGT